MQRAGHQRPISIRATSSTPPSVPSSATIALRLVDEHSLTSAEDAGACPDGEVPAACGGQRHELEIVIQKRIESRLNGRVRNLQVRATADIVILEGQCTTYYTKQLAQHAAMGVLEDEQLENAIVVSVS
jgi:osmotically-inducible protein OsmY